MGILFKMAFTLKVHFWCSKTFKHLILMKLKDFLSMYFSAHKLCMLSYLQLLILTDD